MRIDKLPRHKVFLHALLACLCCALGSGCDKPSSNWDRTVDSGSGCLDGQLGCSCKQDGSCNEGFECATLGNSQICIGESDTSDTADSETITDSGTNTDADAGGDTDTCTPGATGCSCAKGDNCTSPADVCHDDVCTTDTDFCEPGTLGCPCAADACNGILYCNDGNCVDGTGWPGGPCLETGFCNDGYGCSEDICVPCSPGEEGCDCDTGDTCEYGYECVDDRCVYEIEPTEALCYTICTKGFLASDGITYRNCSAEGYMEGCVEGKECRLGSCLREGEEPVTCEDDLGCPEHKTCVGGFCYSNCARKSDCESTEDCYKHVCRAKCVGEDEDCGEGKRCHTIDGENGYCLLMAKESDDPQTQVNGDFSLSATSLTFTKYGVNKTFTLTNNSPIPHTFLIEKLEDTVTFDDGTSISAEAPEGEGECVIAEGTCPLHWLQIGEIGSAARVQDFEITVPAQGEVTLEIRDAADSGGIRWRGRLSVTNEELGRQGITLSYFENLNGRWTGNIYYYGSFSTTNLDNWLAEAETNPDRLAPGTPIVGNALFQKWRAFRKGELDVDEMLAVLTSVQVGSWRWKSLLAACNDGVPESEYTKACYPTLATTTGILPLSADMEAIPVPSGMVELPIAMNLAFDNDEDIHEMNGRVDSTVALQYAGMPAVRLHFFDALDECTSFPCITKMDAMSFEVRVGGRYVTDKTNNDCSDMVLDGNFVHKQVPWLLPGFERATEYDDVTSLRYRYECRDDETPWATEGADHPEILKAFNHNLTRANPVPDGNIRVRTVNIIDGALINYERMIIFFEENMKSFLGDDDPDGFKAYGYMVLSLSDEMILEEEYEGAVPEAIGDEPENVLDATCSENIIEMVLDKTTIDEPGGDLALSDSSVLVGGILTGTASAPTPADLIDEADDEEVHYLCVDEGVFDSGEDDAVPCPAESDVIFFTIDTAETDSTTVTGNSCQVDKTCYDIYLDWVNHKINLEQKKVLWRCTDPHAVICEENRYDLREGKEFYKTTSDVAVFVPLKTEVMNAFRYKTRFKNREGKSIGFAPVECIPGSDEIRYCYDPAAIEEIRMRVDCLMHVWKTRFDELDTDTQDALVDYLLGNYAYFDESPEGEPATPADLNDGFERLYGELLVMMGDESFTKSFASRFDLAGSSLYPFQGTLFEDNGSDLSGGAGYEMYVLYQAVQYYQEALDRFYGMTPLTWLAIKGGGLTNPEVGDNFLTTDTVYWYLDRLVGASTKKARALREIAKRYQNFNKPDLARSVIERAYTSAYLESMVISRFIKEIGDASVPENWKGISVYLDQAQMRYRMALLDMYTDYNNITNDINYFGFAEDYVPFPTLDIAGMTLGQTAFEIVFAKAQSRLYSAKEKEIDAISADRSFETDAAAFQQELVRIRNNYEAQLGEICGTFEGSDGKIYPAIEKYAYLSERASIVGDPCGKAGNGGLHDAMAKLEILVLDVRAALQRITTVEGQIANETERITKQCNLIDEIADYVYEKQGEIHTIQRNIDLGNLAKNTIERGLQEAANLAGLEKCFVVAGTATGSNCPAAVAALAAYEGGIVVSELAITGIEATIMSAEVDIREIERATTRWQTKKQCDAATIDSEARMKDFWLQYAELQLAVLRADYQVKMQIAQIQGLANQAKRVQLEQEETEQMQINVEAARNDPNVRIYRNDAIINADETFKEALRWAYRATKVYEYYTSTTYAQRDKLFLSRMVSAGEYNLEDYLVDIENAYYDFEEVFGAGDTRVMIISLRDDILKIPYLDDNADEYNSNDRITLMRKQLTDTSMLNEKGYWTVPFSTNFGSLSPLTRNHKIKFIEAEIIGSDPGDTVGRIYLVQDGTGVIKDVDDNFDYYRFPKMTAVVDPYFNASRVFDDSVYKNYRFRERPFVNTSWKIVINQRDETANQDIDLNSLTDIRLFVYYTDFTTF